MPALLEHAQTAAAPPQQEAELWTAKQRQAAAIHEISYRGCFKPQLPAYFIERHSAPGDRVYDPFSGRGTTALEAALHGRRAAANDVNPLSALLARPRLELPEPEAIAQRLREIPRAAEAADSEPDLSMFFHEQTLAEIRALRAWLLGRAADGREDAADRWIRMVATNRLTGHSKGFFSAYTLPPNQAASPESQRRINLRLRQEPGYRDTHAIVLRKTGQLLRKLTAEQIARLRAAADDALFLTGAADHTPRLADGSVQLTVTSPPFLDVVQYARDNWLRCWFNVLDAEAIGRGITMARTVEDWSHTMGKVMAELYRVTRRGGWLAFEVGEVRKGKVKLDEHVLPLGLAAGFVCEAVLINTQRFTKTANIWGVANNSAGTNSNRIVLFRKD